MNKAETGKASVAAIIISLLLVGAFFLGKNLTKVSASICGPTCACVSIGPQCGTDNGTQSKVDTKDRDYDWVCPDGYSQNPGNDNCRKLDQAGHWEYADKVIDHEAYYSCPSGWTLDGNKCKRWYIYHWEYQDATYHSATYKCPSGYSDNGINCKKWIDDSYSYKDKVKVYKSCPSGWVVASDPSKCQKTEYQDCHTGVIQYDSCTPAGTCPTACGQPASRVPDGRGGYKECSATSACSTPTPAPVVHKVVTIDQPVPCNVETMQLSGTMVLKGPGWGTISDWLVVRLDGNIIYSLEVNDSMTTWQTGSTAVTPGPHTITATIYDSKSGPTYNNEQATASAAYSVDSCPAGTATPSPTPTESSSSSNSGSNGGSPSAPVCNATKPGTPTITSAVQHGTNVTLTWTAAQNATYYSIVYGDQPGYQYGVANVGNVTTYTVGDLKVGAAYHYAVNAVNDCMPGDPGTFGGGTGGQVLGASTMAGTGTFEQNLYLAIMGFGGIISLFGIKNFKKAYKKA